MLGGFLGAGKSTLLRAVGTALNERGLKVGVITNDQARGLVDTALSVASKLPTAEISGGCFCCRFNSLLEAARSLQSRPQDKPDVFLAEPVGSCTDLVATVSLPLQQLYGEDFSVAPFSVLLDPIRAERLYGLDDGRQFSPNVLYIYRKQLEEAQHILINKIDLLTPERLTVLKETLAVNHPSARIWAVSARDGTGLTAWLDEVLHTELSHPEIMPMDYATYGDGEARLGWLNASLKLAAPEGEEWNGNTWLLTLAERLQATLEVKGIEVAHLKMLLSLAEDAYELAAVNQVRGDAPPELSHRLVDPVEAAHLLINCRAEALPESLRNTIHAAVEVHATTATPMLTIEWEAIEHFSPAMPTPTHGRPL